MKKETIYRKVLVEDRLPELTGWYDTEQGNLYSGNFISYGVEWWLEEIQIPSEEDINYEPDEGRQIKYTPMWWHSEGWKQGAIYILELIGNKK